MPSLSTDRLNGLSTSVAVKAPVAAVTTANITLYGEQTVGGVAVLAEDRVLVKDQTDNSENGIYVASMTEWSRAEDFDGNRDVVQGTLVVTADASPTFYRVATANPIVIGTTGLSFTEVTGVTGGTGSSGLSVAELAIYIRAASLPSTPTGGSYDFDTHTLTPPASWSSEIPAGNQPVYASRTVASITGVSGVDATLTWSVPVKTLSDGQSLDIIFKRSASQPATPADSASTPATWYGTVDEVPAGGDPLWSSVGTRANADENWVWQAPVQVEGSPGADATLYYIKPTQGTAIKNSTGTLIVEARSLVGGTDTLLSTGTIKLYVGSTLVTEANGYAVTSDGYTGTFDSGDISGSVVVTLKDGAGGTALDTITLVDVADGSVGAGTNAVYGYVETNGPLAWTRASDLSTWTPSGTTLQVDCTFLQSAAEVARVAWLITRDSSGLLTGATTTHTGGDLNSGRVTVTEIDEGTQVYTLKFTYSYLGDEAVVTETFYTSMAGGEGAAGNRGPGRFEVAVGASGTGYSISSADASLWNGGTLTNALAAEAAAFVVGAASNGYLETRDEVTIYQSGVQSATRIYTGSRTNSYAGVLAASWSSKVQQTIDGSLVVNGTISADKIVTGSLTATQIQAGSVTSDRLVASSFSVAYNGTTVDLVNGRLIFDDSTYTRITGLPFGTTNQFTDWFGPSGTPGTRTTSGALWYIQADGTAYFGGEIKREYRPVAWGTYSQFSSSSVTSISAYGCTIAAATSSGNGRARITFSSARPSTNYMVVGNGQVNGGTEGTSPNGIACMPYNHRTDYFNLQTISVSGTYTNADRVSFIVFASD